MSDQKMSDAPGMAVVPQAQLVELANLTSEAVRQRDIVAEDLEKALNLLRKYQRVLQILQSPDPNNVEARLLLNKYGMPYYSPTKTSRVFVDGIDITEHPDSIEGTTEDVIELTEEEYFGQERAELVKDEEGNWGLRKIESCEPPQVDTFAQEEDPEEPIDPKSRGWLADDEDEIEGSRFGSNRD